MSDKSMTDTAIYSLLDARARDQRAIILYALSIMCTALGGLMVAVATKNDGAAAMAAVIAATMGYLAYNRGTQIARTIERADEVWLRFDNREHVPPIDVDLPKPVTRIIELRHSRVFLQREQKLLAGRQQTPLGMSRQSSDNPP
ncbi:hypothetical protein GGQ80_000809 [Sphingomonas jinjuensis]|uniref:Uncharacterized protein n=1 Tax=Sphingomonas jinjuensis TaxID=535907 RepID=A0A840F8P4_9SPHN|nr:hypothetical protein [Sphingomonas jinjuensis]MBB4152921.1 hypothetical protein [Sphingomonas jinjuensis]